MQVGENANDASRGGPLSTTQRWSGYSDVGKQATVCICGEGETNPDKSDVLREKTSRVLCQRCRHTTAPEGSTYQPCLIMTLWVHGEQAIVRGGAHGKSVWQVDGSGSESGLHPASKEC